MNLLTVGAICLLMPAFLVSAELCGLQPNPSLGSTRLNLYRGQQEFSVSMLDAIRKATPNENVFFSPYSTYHALLLAYFGATGETEQQLQKILRLNWAKNKEEVRSAYTIEKADRLSRADKMPLVFKSADRLFFNKDITLANCLENRLSEEIAQMDFSSHPDESRIAINNWIANVTENEIRETLAEGDIDSRTQVVLANAAYFKGQWQSKFDSAKTEQMPFYTSSKKMSLVPMMRQKGNFALTTDERLGAYVLQMPYKTTNKNTNANDDFSVRDDDDDSEISMVIILPPVGLNSLELVLSNLNATTLSQSLKEGIQREIDVSMPKFDFEQRLELVPILKEMGLSTLFESAATFGDFSTNRDISFNDAKHVAKIKVDEEGSTAAAATVLVSFRSARPIEPTKFECKHPFLFLIYDHKANAILFTGIYRDPKTKKE
ncbi:uncharacterized protein Dwil_GK13977 [Drosophila willistoni]|uniref:Serpin domain-containing protein n=1 Tax=Drosophila willistoni TaxID=7260 RepID=B4NKS9_DROWI|nr:serine protease inhibitor 88Ea [Drosophila willistoni]EDW84140.2 uncharacterized protein Dwil_GK13977 [Drosophila willistoni]